MRLCGNNKALIKVFKEATVPDIAEFRGEYLVDMLSWLPSFKRFSHRKVFYCVNGKTYGHNVLSGRTWGYFILEEGVCTDMGSTAAAVINYDRTENTFITRRIRDFVRCVEHGRLYIGRFCYIFSGRPRFLGYFSLSRIP